MKKKIWFLAVSLILILILFLAFGLKRGQEVGVSDRKVLKVGMGYIPNVQFVPFYVAQEKGFYEAAGFEVEFDYAMSPDLLKLLGQEKLDFVVATGDEVLLAVDKGIPVKYVMTLYERFPVSIVSLKESGIVKADDLEGKSIGIPGFYGSSYIGLKAFLKEVEISEDEVNLEAIGYTQVQSLVEEKVDSVVVFSINEAVQMKERGYEINEIELSDFINLVSAGLVTSDGKIEKESEFVKKFVEATWQGMEYALSNQEEAFEICQKHVEISEEEKEVQFEVMKVSQEFWKKEGQIVKDLKKENWEETIEILKESGLIENQNLDFESLVFSF